MRGARAPLGPPGSLDPRPNSRAPMGWPLRMGLCKLTELSGSLFQALLLAPWLAPCEEVGRLTCSPAKTFDEVALRGSKLPAPSRTGRCAAQGFRAGEDRPLG